MADCPVCGWPGLAEPPRNADGQASFEICPSCGYQFGHSDEVEGYGYEQWRAEWTTKGMPWWAEEPPAPDGWDPGSQVEAVSGTG